MRETEKVAGYFDELAEGWDARYRRSRFFRQRIDAFEHAIRQYGTGTQRALDYGCGSGILTRILAATARNAVACDISEKMLEQTRRAFSEKPNVSVVHAEALTQGAFDLIVCSSVIEYVPDDLGLLRKLRGLLSPEGRLLITFARKWGFPQMWNRIVLGRIRKGDQYTPFQRHLYTGASVQRVMREAELAPLSVAPAVGLPLFPQMGLGEFLFVVATPQRHESE